MSYCVTPGCLTPENPDSARFCRSCGSKLWLQERYRSIQPIGRGGFGRTFLAVDENIPSQPHCVIKQLYIQNPGTEVFPKAVELFHQEAVRLDELGKHPQIPTLLAHFEQNQQLYLVQELIPGQTLMQELQQKGAYDENQIWALLKDLLPVVQYVHSHQVIHRDIKPSNIIRRTHSTPKSGFTSPQLSNSGEFGELGSLVLIDFGVAKLLTDTALLHTGTIIGSPEYMAPEQIKGKVLPASDLYSLGVTCLQLLTGVPPFDLFDAINDCWVWRDFLPSGKLVSDRLGKILDKLVQNTIKDRYQSADQVLQYLNPTPKAPHQLIQPHPGDNLVSQVSINYTRLRNLLARKKWLEADQETWDIFCQLSARAPGYYLKTRDIENLPCEDLLTIDRLWLKYSDGHFGFSVQKHIYQAVGEDYLSFCDRVGWPIHNPPHLESTLKFNLKAPLGHLPSRRWVGGYQWWHHAGTMAAKLELCKLGDSLEG